MKKAITLFLLIISHVAISQDKRTTKTGEITFEASVPSFEEVKATSKGASCILNTETGEITALALVKGFHFKNVLMEENFNENYIESTKYPKIIFKGKIEDFEASRLTDTPQKYIINGILELHGKTKTITSIAMIKKVENNIDIKNNFTVNPEDFDIIIPSIVSKKIARNVDVTCHYNL